MKARDDVGLKIDKEEMATNFMQFLVEDEVLPGIDDVDDEETPEWKSVDRMNNKIMWIVRDYFEEKNKE